MLDRIRSGGVRLGPDAVIGAAEQVPGLGVVGGGGGAGLQGGDGFVGAALASAGLGSGTGAATGAGSGAICGGVAAGTGGGTGSTIRGIGVSAGGTVPEPPPRTPACWRARRA